MREYLDHYARVMNYLLMCKRETTTIVKSVESYAPMHPIPPHKAIYGFHAALAHNDGHISRLFVDCMSYIQPVILLVAPISS